MWIRNLMYILHWWKSKKLHWWDNKRKLILKIIVKKWHIYQHVVEKFHSLVDEIYIDYSCTVKISKIPDLKNYIIINIIYNIIYIYIMCITCGKKIKFCTLFWLKCSNSEKIKKYCIEKFIILNHVYQLNMCVYIWWWWFIKWLI